MSRRTDGPSPSSDAGESLERERTASAEVKRMSRTDHALIEIQRRLVHLEYAPGSTFTEAEVAAAVGATRTPVREALLLLSADRLVKPRPGAGYLVSAITLRDVRSVFAHSRRLLPDGMEMLATRGISGRLLSELSALLDGSHYPRKEDRITRLCDFYSWLMAQTEDQLLDQDFTRLALALERMLRLAIVLESEVDLAPEQELLVALSSDAPAEARKIVVRRMTDLEQQVLERLLDSDALMSANLGVHTQIR